MAEIEEFDDAQLAGYIRWYEEEAAKGYPFDTWERMSYLDALREKTKREIEE